MTPQEQAAKAAIAIPDWLAEKANQYSAQPASDQSDYAFGKGIGAYNGYVTGYLAACSDKDAEIELKRPHKPFIEWNAEDYDMAANIIAKAMNLTSSEWGIIRYAIRNAVESNSSKTQQ